MKPFGSRQEAVSIGIYATWFSLYYLMRDGVINPAAFSWLDQFIPSLVHSRRECFAGIDIEVYDRSYMLALILGGITFVSALVSKPSFREYYVLVKNRYRQLIDTRISTGKYTHPRFAWYFHFSVAVAPIAIAVFVFYPEARSCSINVPFRLFPFEGFLIIGSLSIFGEVMAFLTGKAMSVVRP